MVAGAADHGGHDGNQFGGFLFKRFRERWGDAAFFAEEFEPEHTFVGFLQGSPELRNELPAPSSAALWADCARLSRSTRLTFRSRARRFLDMRGDRGSRAKQLFTQDADFLMVPWKADIKLNDGRSMPLRPVSKLFRQYSAHLISTFSFPLSVFCTRITKSKGKWKYPEKLTTEMLKTWKGKVKGREMLFRLVTPGNPIKWLSAGMSDG
jgi:hypothetical protein